MNEENECWTYGMEVCLDLGVWIINRWMEQRAWSYKNFGLSFLLFFTCCTICSGMSWVIGVSVNPGRTALHLIPNLQRKQ